MTTDTGRPSPLVAWLQATRPRTLTAAVGAVVVGSSHAHALGRHHWDVTAAALGVAMSLQIASNLYNDYGDYVRGADAERIGPARAATAGWITPNAIRGGALVAIAVAIACGLFIVMRIGWPALAIGVVAITSAIAYTAGPAPLAYVGLGDVFVLAFFGVVAVNGTVLAQTGDVTTTSLFASLAVGTMATAILVVNNLRDRNGDAKVGKRTLVVRFGQRFGRAEYVLLVVVAYLVPVAFALHEWRVVRLLPLATLPFAYKRVHAILTLDGAALNPELGRTALLGLAFNLFFAGGLVA